MPPATQNGISSTARHASHPFAIDRPAFGARRDVVEHQLVRPLVAIARSELEDVAHDRVIAEAHALDDLAVADVEAGDDAFGKNGRNSSGVIRSSSSALPLTAAATPISRQRSKIGRITHAAGGLPRNRGKRARALRYRFKSGPAARRRARCPCTSTCLTIPAGNRLDGLPQT